MLMQFELANWLFIHVDVAWAGDSSWWGKVEPDCIAEGQTVSVDNVAQPMEVIVAVISDSSSD